MTSARNDGSSDVMAAYQRAIAREENDVLPHQPIAAIPSPVRAVTSQHAVDEDIDLYRHHSRQSSQEGG